MIRDNMINKDQIIGRLLRNDAVAISEKTNVISPGGKANVRSVKIKSLVNNNVYNVIVVNMATTSSLPLEYGNEIEAVNLAEAFDQTGQLSAGTYAIMVQDGDTNVIYVQI